MHSTPAGHDDVVGPGHHALGGEVDGLLGGAALAVDGGGRHRLGPSGGQHRVATDVERLLAHLHDAAGDDVVDERRVEVVARLEGLERLGGQVDGVPVAELAVALAAGGADGVDDHGGGHGGPPPFRRRAACRSSVQPSYRGRRASGDCRHSRRARPASWAPPLRSSAERRHR